ncbi:hypothetical protein C7445_10960 [Alicyclobacillus sacchari]|uniref:Uncharacterized protein n=1 Tax=Alicyclobacillus sacchari TaxID=392010 RepID=A0A4R8LKC7_9BACL|nr:hypothetical protein C7445_10960 [Alicyclobacillus sacchari]
MPRLVCGEWKQAREGRPRTTFLPCMGDIGVSCLWGREGAMTIRKCCPRRLYGLPTFVIIICHIVE